jgi:hypothetical protein
MQPRKPDDSREPEPVSYHQLEQRRRAGPGEDKPNFDFSELPPQPSGPWSGSDPGPGIEPSVDRTEDGTSVGVPIDQT